MTVASRRWLPLAALVTAGIAVYASGLHRELSLAGLQHHRETLQAFVAAAPAAGAAGVRGCLRGCHGAVAAGGARS